MGTHRHEYLVRVVGDDGQPYPIQATSRAQAARQLAQSTKPLPGAGIEVYTQSEWRLRLGPATYTVTEINGHLDVE